MASVLEETMGRKAGLASGGSVWPDSMKWAGSSFMRVGSSAWAPETFRGYVAGWCMARAEMAAGNSMGMPAPTITTAAPASMAP